MLDFFSQPKGFVGKLSNFTLDRYYEQQTRSIEKVIKYERGHGARIDSDHILLKLLYGLPTISSDARVDFFNATTEVDLELANSLGITCSRGEGDITKNTFYPGKNILILDRTKIKFTELVKLKDGDWVNMEPVRCLKINDTFNPLSLAKNIPYNEGEEWSYSVVSINIALFGLMAKMWSDENIKKERDQRETPMMFVSRYVIPNMLMSQVHAGLVNDLYRTLVGAEIKRDKPNSSQWLLDFSEEIVVELRGLIEEMPLTSLELEEGLSVLPTIDGSNFLSKVPDLNDRYTILSLWALYPAVIDLLLLGQYIVKRSDTGSSNFRHRFRYHARQYTNNGAMRKANDPKIRRVLEDSLDRMIISLG